MTLLVALYYATNIQIFYNGKQEKSHKYGKEHLTNSSESVQLQEICSEQYTLKTDNSKGATSFNNLLQEMQKTMQF